MVAGFAAARAWRTNRGGGRQITMERAEEYTKPERSKPTKKGGDNERGQMNGHRWAAGEEGREGGQDYTKD